MEPKGKLTVTVSLLTKHLNGKVCVDKSRLPHVTGYQLHAVLLDDSHWQGNNDITRNLSTQERPDNSSSRLSTDHDAIKFGSNKRQAWLLCCFCKGLPLHLQATQSQLVCAEES